MISLQPTRRLVAGITVAALGAVAVPATASAAAIATGKCPTYVPGLNDHSRYVGVAGAGWTPGSTVSFAYSGRGGSAGTVATSASGSFNSAIHGPKPSSVARGSHLKHFTLTATDGANQQIKATAALKVVRLGVAPAQQGSPYARVTRKVYGFPRGKKVFSHYAFKGKVRRTVYLGKAKGACGVAKKKMRSQPAHPRVGHWNVYYSNARRFTGKDARKRRFVIRTSFTEKLQKASTSAVAAVERSVAGRQAA